MFQRLIIVLVFINMSFAASMDDDLGETIFVSILYRHGDRTPIEPYPKDPYKNISLWPVGWGQLTDIGKRGHYELGKWLRGRYSKLLPIKYKKDDIYIQSTNVDRTLMSAYSNLAGLYEPDPASNWNPDIKWQPIPVHTIPQTMDMVLAAKKPCLRYERYLSSLRASEKFRKIDAENKGLYEYLSKHTGLTITEVKQLGDIHNTLFIESLYNFTLPDWTLKVYPQPLKKWADFGFQIPCYNQKMARLKVGPLLSDITMHMQKKISGSLKPDRKAWVYSAHDLTVANVLQSLGVFDAQCPPYLSLVLIELRKKDADYYVAIHYKNSTTEPPFFMQIPGCDKLCPFNKFSDLIAPIIPRDWEKECQYSLLTDNIYQSISGESLILSVSLLIMFLVFAVVVASIYKNHNSNQSDFTYQSLKMEMHS